MAVAGLTMLANSVMTNSGEGDYSKVPPVEGAVKLPGDQGWRDPQGNIWKKDKLHKDHWDVTDRAGEKIKEVDFSGRQIWPGGPKNMNKK